MRILISASILLIAISFAADAASIVKSNDPECRVDIVGPIVNGDFDRLLGLEDHLLVLGPDSTEPSVVCLDSPGGSVFDGLKIAEFILENGVSTRIRQDKKCYSICAIMFMMGNVRGPEMDHINRRMHATAKLGFHRPRLTVQDAVGYTAGDIEAAYNHALLTLLQMMDLAIQNEPWGTGQMIEPDLLRIMIETPPHEMHLVERIEEVVRWNIGVDGLPDVTKPSAGHLHFACENLLSREVGLSSVINRAGSLYSVAAFDLAFGALRDLEYITDAPKFLGDAPGVNVNRDAPELYEVRNARTGLTSVWCKVAYELGTVKACGVDGSTGFHLGDCEDDFGWWLHRSLVLHHPSSMIHALFKTNKQNVEGALSRPCRATFSDTDLNLDQECLQTVMFGHADGGRGIVHSIAWDEGLETQVYIIMKRSSENASSVYVNGKPAEFFDGGAGETCVRRLDRKMSLCLGAPVPVL